MRFQVPQFIEVEDKLFGPFTFKQFVYLAGSAGVTVGAFSFLPTFLAVFISAPFLILGVCLAFYKVNNRPFIFILESFFKYITKEKLYVWKKEEKQATPGIYAQSVDPSVYVPKLSNSKLKDLSWSLDVKQGTEQDQNPESI